MSSLLHKLFVPLSLSILANNTSISRILEDTVLKYLGRQFKVDLINGAAEVPVILPEGTVEIAARVSQSCFSLPLPYFQSFLIVSNDFRQENFIDIVVCVTLPPAFLKGTQAPVVALIHSFVFIVKRPPLVLLLIEGAYLYQIRQPYLW